MIDSLDKWEKKEEKYLIDAKRSGENLLVENTGQIARFFHSEEEALNYAKGILILYGKCGKREFDEFRKKNYLKLTENESWNNLKILYAEFGHYYQLAFEPFYEQLCDPYVSRVYAVYHLKKYSTVKIAMEEIIGVETTIIEKSFCY